eukprot:1863905-Pleurochrysis_carterae.AAC.3
MLSWAWLCRVQGVDRASTTRARVGRTIDADDDDVVARRRRHDAAARCLCQRLRLHRQGVARQRSRAEQELCHQRDAPQGAARPLDLVLFGAFA